MIDPGATNNLISNQAIQKLGIRCGECEKFGVDIVGQVICWLVTLQIQGLEIVKISRFGVREF